MSFQDKQGEHMAMNVRMGSHRNFVVVPQLLDFRDAPTKFGNCWT